MTQTNQGMGFPPNLTPTFSSTVAPRPIQFTMKSIFSDNSLVYYKPHSLASGGVGTTKNNRHKSKKT